jgi:GT2 family glycosyltransferase
MNRQDGEAAALPSPGAPRISVVMAVYNGERYVGEAIDSILAQDYADFEFLIVNDGSTDASRDIAASYDDPRVVIIDNVRNIGLAASLNRGLARARGEFIARQDADDISLPDRFARQIAFLEANPEVVLIGSAHAEVDEHGRIVNEVDAHCDHAMIAWSLLFFCPFVHTAVMFRRVRVLENVGVYDPTYHYSMDFEYWSRIAARYPVANLPERLVHLRFHPGSMTATFGDRTTEGHRLRVRELSRLLALDELPHEEQEAVHRRLTDLLFGPWSCVDASAVLRSVDDVLRLQEAFAHDAGLSDHEAAAHRFALRRHLGRVMLECGRTLSSGSGTGTAAVPQLAWQAVRLNGRISAHPRTLMALAGLVARGVIMVPIARSAAWVRGQLKRGGV